MGGEAAAAVPRLTQVLERGDPYLYGRAALAVKAIGSDARAAAPALAATVTGSTHGEMVAYALDALRSVGPPPDAMPRLIELACQQGDILAAYQPSLHVDHGFYPEIATPLIPWLAGECLKAMGPSVIEPVTAALKDCKTPAHGTAWTPFAVLAHFGSAAKGSLPEVERLIGSIPRKEFSHHVRAWCRVQLARIRGESTKFVRMCKHAPWSQVPLEAGDAELEAVLRGERTAYWSAAVREMCRRSPAVRKAAFDALAIHVDGAEKARAATAVELMRQHARACDDAAARRAVAALAAKLESATGKEELLPVIRALAAFGRQAAPAVEALEEYLAIDRDVEQAIEEALVKIRG
jgi:hypothetical protein